MRRFFAMKYRLRVHDVETDWKTLVLGGELYTHCVTGPGPLTALHWHMGEVFRTLEKLESDVCKVIDFCLYEVTRAEAVRFHVETCPVCQSHEVCSAQKLLEEGL